MIFAILFILVFLIGAVTYHFTSQWWHGIAIATGLFCLNVLLDTSAHEYWSISLIFGLPIVFVAALLGAYVVEQRRPQEEVAATEAEGSLSAEGSHSAEGSLSAEGSHSAEGSSSDVPSSAEGSEPKQKD